MSSGFISETEIVEARRQRQEEWEKVRTDDQPKEAPEEVYDSRPLYQRLEEQKQKKDAEYEETHKLKNMIRGLDDDEVGFLELVERSKASAARQISIDEQREMHDFRERVRGVQEAAEQQRLAARLAQPARAPSAPSARRLPAVIVRKRKIEDTKDEATPQKLGNGSSPVDKRRAAGGGATTPPSLATHQDGQDGQDEPQSEVNARNENGQSAVKQNGHSKVATSTQSALVCVGVLPGLGHYAAPSSDSGGSSDSDDARQPERRYDLCGRLQKDKPDKS